MSSPTVFRFPHIIIVFAIGDSAMSLSSFLCFEGWLPSFTRHYNHLDLRLFFLGFLFGFSQAQALSMCAIAPFPDLGSFLIAEVNVLAVPANLGFEGFPVKTT